MLERLITEWGWGVVALSVAIECLGIPLPAETMLIAASLHAGVTGGSSIHAIVIATAIAAILGDNAGYAVGRTLGQSLVVRYGGRIGITAARLLRVRGLFDRHGAKVVVFGRFVALLRTLSSLAAGIAHMDWRRFLIANAVGGVLWACTFGYGAYWLGDRIRVLEGPYMYIVLGVVALAGALGIWLAHRHEKSLGG